MNLRSSASLLEWPMSSVHLVKYHDDQWHDLEIKVNRVLGKLTLIRLYSNSSSFYLHQHFLKPIIMLCWGSYKHQDIIYAAYIATDRLPFI